MIQTLRNKLLRKFPENSLKCFVIISIPRSGSNYLCGLLNSHPDILCHHELFHRDEIYYALDHRDGGLNLGTKEQRNHKPKRFIQSVWENNFHCSAVGFKIFPGHNKKALDLLMKSSNIKKIILRRENQLKSYTSNLIAKKTGVYAKHRDSSLIKNLSKTTIKIDFDDLKKYIASNNIFFSLIRNRLEETQQKFIEVSYEELVGTHKIQVRKSILNYIGLEDFHMLQETHNRQNSRSLSEIIENYDELVGQITGTDLENFLSFDLEF
ncbi:MAG: sulfotransferase [Leptolyngbya sp. SIO3F4]|nr:sulfotransferase [Leptolyngbya sp. SIO3F4]